MNKILLAIAIFANGLAVFAQGIPNTFSAGDTVSASKINQNFSYLDGKGKRLVLKNDAIVIGDASYVYDFNFQYTKIMVTTKKGYVTFMNNPDNSSWEGQTGAAMLDNLFDSGTTRYFYYTNSSCTGASVGNTYGRGALIYAGWNTMYYVPLDATSETLQATYKKSGVQGACQSYTGTLGKYYPILSNNPEVTGWPSTIGTLTIAYE